MTKYYTLLLLFLCSAIGTAQDKFIGKWTSENGNLSIEMYIQNDAYYAKITASKNTAIQDKVVLVQMVKKSETQLYGGMYYDDGLKSEYEARLRITDENTMRLKILAGLSSKTIVWHRN